MNGHVDDFEATWNEKGKQSAVEMAGRSAKRAAEIKPRCNDLMVALHCVSVCVTACVRVSFPRHFHSALSADDARERKLSPSSDHVSPFVKYSTRSCSGAKFPQNSIKMAAESLKFWPCKRIMSQWSKSGHSGRSLRQTASRKRPINCNAGRRVGRVAR